MCAVVWIILLIHHTVVKKNKIQIILYAFSLPDSTVQRKDWFITSL